MQSYFVPGADFLDEDYQALLLEYASGALEGGLALMMAAYVAVCPEARDAVARFEALGGALIEGCCDPVGMNDHSLNRVLERLGKDDAGAASACGGGRDGSLPEPVKRHLEAFGIGQLRWRKVWFGMSVVHMFPQAGENNMTVMRLAPGASPPEHRHETPELTLVLNGGLSDGAEEYRTGDLFVCDAGTMHKPKACPLQGCTCMVMTAEPVLYRHPLVRIFHTLMT